MKVRPATHDDLFDVMVLARQFSKAAPEMHKWNKEKVEAQLEASIDSPDHTLLVVEEDDGEISGGLLGLVTEMYINHTRVAAEMAWFMSKEYRGGKQALKLVDAFEEWGASVGAEYVIMADIKAVADLSSLYKRKGFEEVEASYARRIK